MAIVSAVAVGIATLIAWGVRRLEAGERREREAMQLQDRIAEAISREPRLRMASMVPVVSVPRRGPVIVELTVEVASVHARYPCWRRPGVSWPARAARGGARAPFSASTGWDRRPHIRLTDRRWKLYRSDHDPSPSHGTLDTPLSPTPAIAKRTAGSCRLPSRFHRAADVGTPLTSSSALRTIVLGFACAVSSSLDLAVTRTHRLLSVFAGIRARGRSRRDLVMSPVTRARS